MIRLNYWAGGHVFCYLFHRISHWYRVASEASTDSLGLRCLDIEIRADRHTSLPTIQSQGLGSYHWKSFCVYTVACTCHGRRRCPGVGTGSPLLKNGIDRCCDQSARQRILTECNAICSPRILPANGTKRPSEHFSPRFRCILFTREKLTSCEKMSDKNDRPSLHIKSEVIRCGDSNRCTFCPFFQHIF